MPSVYACLLAVFGRVFPQYFLSYPKRAKFKFQAMNDSLSVRAQHGLTRFYRFLRFSRHFKLVGAKLVNVCVCLCFVCGLGYH